MAATTHLLTVEEFWQIPDNPGVRQELYHGELITMPPPKLRHRVIQHNILGLLKARGKSGSRVYIELPFRPLPEHELWSADVAYIPEERFRMLDPSGDVQGAPDLVVEVLSPSNNAAAMYDREEICLANGCQEFWVVDPKKLSIRVTTRDGRTNTYVSGDHIQLAVFGSEDTLSVDSVFAD